MTKAELIAALAPIPDNVECVGYFAREGITRPIQGIVTDHGVPPSEATFCLLMLDFPGEEQRPWEAGGTHTEIPVDWMGKINAELERLGVHPTLEAYPIAGAPQWVAWVDTQELTVLDNPEGIYHILAGLLDEADIDAIWYAIRSHINEDAAAQVAFESATGYRKV
jgi:hypothetical protein